MGEQIIYSLVLKNTYNSIIIGINNINLINFMDENLFSLFLHLPQQVVYLQTVVFILNELR